MKTTRTVGALGGVALIAGISLFAAAPAHAAEIPVTLPVPIPAENPAGYDATWFAGTVTGGNGTLTQSAAGLTITGGANGYQLLNGSAEDLVGLTLNNALGSAFEGSIGDAFYQVPVFGEPSAAPADREFTTLRPVVADDLWGPWTTSRSVAGLTANAPYTVAQLVAALDAGEAAKVLAFGVFVNAGDTVLVRGISFNGDDYLFYTGEPTLTASVTSLELKNVTQPITLTASGFQPGQDVYFGVGNGGSGGGIGDAPVVADASGVATVQYSFPADTELGTYYFSAADESGYFGVSIEFTVIANQLAATGEGVNPWFLGAGILLALGGTGAIIFARRAKKA